MTEHGQQAAAIWREADFAHGWAQGDGFRDVLAFPRRMAAVIVAGDRPDPGLIVDVGSGPGDFLAVMLQEFPSARGIWTDASEAMLGLAHDRLAEFGDRVEFRIADMTDLAAAAGTDAGGFPSAGVITTSRAVHHLDRAGLFGFYQQAASLLNPGGWLINLDHIGPAGPGDVWDKRLRAARRQFGVAPSGPQHHHTYPLTSVADHLQAFAAAGFCDVEVAWRAFFTCLFMGRKDS
jgi:SAM-dependent methyltransferase